MKVSEVIAALEEYAPAALQEEYDNTGLLVGNPADECTGILCTLDVTEGVVAEAVSRGCNLIVAHHPLIFRGLKRITGGNQVERVVMQAIKSDVAVFASHTNLDNVIAGVNGKIADKLGLKNRILLEHKPGILKKLFTFVPQGHLDSVRDALFAAGAGKISNYSECSFTHEGTGTFKPGTGTNPFSGEIGKRQNEAEIKLEVILPAYKEAEVISALFRAHPYEEIAYDLVNLSNHHQGTGSGLIGEIDPIKEIDFLERLALFNPHVVRHTPLTDRQIKKVAVCGGAGSFLISRAIRAGADAYITADLKYHEFFAADGRMLLCDIGHFESEQFTTDLFIEILEGKFPTFAVLKSEIETNPVRYFLGK